MRTLSRLSLKRLALFIAAGVLTAAVLLGGWIAYVVPKPWRSGWVDRFSDCSHSRAGSPMHAEGAQVAMEARRGKLCALTFAQQRESETPTQMQLMVAAGELTAGELRVSLMSYDGWRRIDRVSQRLQAPADLSRLKLELPVSPRATLVEVSVTGRNDTNVQLEGLRLRETAPAAASVQGRALYDEAMDIIADHALRADQLPDDFRTRWRPPADATAGEARKAIKDVLNALGDNHSFMMDPTRKANLPHVARATFTAPRWELLEEGIGYIEVPRFTTGSATLNEQYVDALVAALEAGTARGVRGWVVDLRQNSGGIMWPMLSGLEPLLRGQSLGFFQTRDGNRQAWRNKVPHAAAEVRSLAEVPVAVLTSRRTASSGEAVALAFRGRPHTRSFGEATAGLSTANRGHGLRDGTLILLTGSVFLDRNGQGDGSPVEPDEGARDLLGSNRSQEAAVAWLRKQR